MYRENLRAKNSVIIALTQAPSSAGSNSATPAKSGLETSQPRAPYPTISASKIAPHGELQKLQPEGVVLSYAG